MLFALDRYVLAPSTHHSRSIQCVINISSYVADCNGATQAEINNHLELGKQFLARGQLADALSHYHAAVGKFSQSIVCCVCVN